MMARPTVLLPHPDSPTSASVSPRSQSEGDTVDRAHFADLSRENTAGDRESNAQILDFKQRHYFSTSTHRTQWPGETSINSGS